MTSKGQTVLEYVFLIGIVTIALVYMGTDFRRGIQSAVKLTADQLGNQVNSDQDFISFDRSGLLINSLSKSAVNRQNIKSELNEIFTTKENETTQTFTNSYTNVSGPNN